MNNLLVAILNKMCWFLDCTGAPAIQELELNQQGYDELKNFAKWMDESSANLAKSPTFDWNHQPILPKIEKGLFEVNGYAFNIKIQE